MLELVELCAALSPKGNFVHWNPSSISRIAVDYYPNDFTEKLTWIFDEASRLTLVIHDSTVSITSVN
ncbi:hypothetical protein PF010_g6231 [Phytophthora fragariae]|uniref:Uncharacterized protein n=1 Tax=Phytophthora fragariae TaxID=53985 RepID=A0A6G0LMC0_9STRA|nr:hypothetical protein PF010_g6231 [Phytophthora fragariae]